MLKKVTLMGDLKESQMGVMEELLMCFCKVINFNRAFGRQILISDGASGSEGDDCDMASGSKI